MPRPKRYHSIKAKIILYQVLTLSIVIAFIGLLSNITLRRRVISDAQQIDVELVRVMNQSFDEMTASFKRMFNYVTMNEELQRLLQYTSPEDGNVYLEANRRIHSIAVNQTVFVKQIHAFYVFDLENLRIGYKRRYVFGEPEQLYSPLNTQDFSPLGNVTIEERDGTLLFLRTIRSLQTLDPIGYAVATFDKAYIQKHINTVNPNQSRVLLLLDQNQRLIAHNRSDQQAQAMLESLKPPYHSAVQMLENVGQSVVTVDQSAVTGWRVISITPVRQLSQSYMIIPQLVIWIGVLGLLMGSFATYLYATSFVRPIQRLTRLVKKVEKDNDFSIRFEYNVQDEVGALGHSFNHMIQTIRRLINDVYYEEIQRKDAQLRALQAQVNPHFLYNTLECINWLAEFNKPDQIKSITIAFSNIMKASARPDKLVTVSQEIALAKDLLTIYEISLQGKLKTYVHIQQKLLERRIPKLILQPLIENAVIHGIKKSIGGGSLQVSGTIRDNRAVFQVMDDGAGMPEALAAAIHAYVRGEKTQRDDQTQIGIGIRNVIDRLHVFYGSNVGFTVRSHPGLGTQIEIAIDLIALEVSEQSHE